MIKIWLHSQIAKIAPGNNTDWVVEKSDLPVRNILQEAFGSNTNLLFGIIDETGKLRPHINIFVGTWNIKRNLDEIVKDNEEISIFPSVSGG